MNFSISFIALFGVCIQNGVILISLFCKNLEANAAATSHTRWGYQPGKACGNDSHRPVTCAITHGIGSEPQKPLAIVVIGGRFVASFRFIRHKSCLNMAVPVFRARHV